MMTGLLSVMVPEAGTNLISNPSAELASTGYSAGLSTLSRVTNYARFGITALKVVTANVSTAEGIVFNYDDTLLPATAGQTYTFSVYVRGAGTVQLAIGWLNSSHAQLSAISGAILTLANTGWTRYSLTGTAPASTVYASVGVLTTSQQAVTFYCDGWQFENKDNATTYIDGDQPGGTWSGLYHGSASSRDANYRQGGEEVFLDDYGITLDMALAGIGLPPIVNNVSDYALLPGAQWQSTQIKSRLIDLVATAAGTSLAELLQKRQSLIDLFGPARGGQPARIGYWGADADRPIYCDVRYVQGLQFSNAQGFIEKPAIRLLAVDPYWYADDAETAALNFTANVSNAAYGLRRSNGQWTALGSGFNGNVIAIAVDKQRGRVYFGGGFSTANGVTVNGICYWDGTTFVALGSGVSGRDATVYSIAIAPNGDVWVGGSFNSVGSTTHAIARWNIATSTWTTFTLGANTELFYALGFDKNGILYAGGSFTNWNGNANSDYIMKYDGSSWSALGTGTNDYVLGLALDGSNNLYCVGNFTAAGGTTVNYVAKWNGAAWAALGTTGLSGGTTKGQAVIVLHDGRVIVGGTFTAAGGVNASNIAQWNGTSWSALGSGVNNLVVGLAEGPDGILWVGGTFTSAGGIGLADRMAGWNGSSWFHPDVNLPGTPSTQAIAAVANGDLFIGFSTTGTATAAGITTITPVSTAEVYPVITVVGPSSGSAVLEFIENQTTKQRMYFNLTINAGETVTIDLRTGRKTVTSNWRGLVSDQPLRNSDFANWRLQPGTNTIAAFVTGTTTGAALVANWQPAYLSVDGNA